MTYYNNIKQFYIVVASNYRWGRSTDRKEAIKNAEVKRGVDYVIYIGLVKPEATEEQVKNIMMCFNVTDGGGVSMYTDGPELEADKAMVNQLMIGWMTERFESKKKS